LQDLRNRLMRKQEKDLCYFTLPTYKIHAR
jgi:hypothetical protein